MAIPQKECELHLAFGCSDNGCCWRTHMNYGILFFCAAVFVVAVILVFEQIFWDRPRRRHRIESKPKSAEFDYEHEHEVAEGRFPTLRKFIEDPEAVDRQQEFKQSASLKMQQEGSKRSISLKAQQEDSKCGSSLKGNQPASLKAKAGPPKASMKAIQQSSTKESSLKQVKLSSSQQCPVKMAVKKSNVAQTGFGSSKRKKSMTGKAAGGSQKKA